MKVKRTSYNKIFTSIEEDWVQRITPIERRFCITYARTWDAGKSVKEAGYRVKDAKQKVRDLFYKKPWLKIATEEIRSDYFYRLGTSERSIIEMVAESAFVDPEAIYDKDGNLLKVVDLPKDIRRMVIAFDDDGYPTKLEGRREYTKMIMRHKSLFNDKIDVRLTEDMLKELLGEMTEEDKKTFKDALKKYLLPDEG